MSPWIPRVIALTGILLLAHAWYSSREFNTIQSHRSITSLLATHGPHRATNATVLPVDVSIEAIVATVIACLGVVLGAPSLRPIRWNVWAGNIERGGDAGVLGDSSGKGHVPNPFRFLDTRPGFVDVRRDRRLFTSWVKETGQ